jgi:hypothetical protein
MRIGLIIGEINEAHKKAIWEKTNLVWIDPTKDMSPHQVNEFRNRSTEMFLSDERDNEDDEILFIWTNNQELINSIQPEIIWRVDDGKLFENRKKVDLTPFEAAGRNWDIY